MEREELQRTLEELFGRSCLFVDNLVKFLGDLQDDCDDQRSENRYLWAEIDRLKVIVGEPSPDREV